LATHPPAGSNVGANLQVSRPLEATPIDPEKDPVFVARKGYYRASTLDALRTPPMPPMALIAAEHTAQLKGRYLVARGEADAPDIDGRIYVRGKLPIGEFARVKIIGHTDYDLIAEPV